jgi:hypothetical protein
MIRSSFTNVACMVVCLVLVSGCGPKAPVAEPQPLISEQDQRIANLTRERTDQFIRDIAVGNGARLPSYFLPGVSLDLKEQLQKLLEVPPRTRFRVTLWDANSAVKIAPDRRRAQTFPMVHVKVGDSQPILRIVVLNWVASDETWQTFHLDPAK